MSTDTDALVRDAAYDKIDRFLRNNLDDANYADYSRALEEIYAANTIERLTRERDEAVARSAPKTLEEELAALDTTGIFQDSPAFDEHFRKRISTYADKHPTLLVRQLASRLRASWASTDEAVARERERCARICDTTPPYPFRPSIEAAHAIRTTKATT
jgi:hypothetical protein